MDNYNTKDGAGTRYVAPKAYGGQDIRKIAMRPGSLDVLEKPSRIGSTLFYPDGTILKDPK